MFRKMLAFRLGDFIRSIAGSGAKWLARLRNLSAGIPASTTRLLTAHGEPIRGTTPTPDPDAVVIFILGPPGAGKGTQCAALRAAFPGRLTHLSYGDLLRYQDAIPGSWVSSLARRGSGSGGGDGKPSGSPLVPADAAARLVRETVMAGTARGQHGM